MREEEVRFALSCSSRSLLQATTPTKRKAPETPQKRNVRQRRSAVDGLVVLADSISKGLGGMSSGSQTIVMANAFPTTPERCARAIEQLDKEDPPLDPDDHDTAIDMLSSSPKKANAYLHLAKGERRRQWLEKAIRKKALD